MSTEDLAQHTAYIQLNRGVTEAEKSIQVKYSVLTALSLKKNTCMLYHRHKYIVSLEIPAK